MSISTRTPPEVPSRRAEAEAAEAQKRKRTLRIEFYISAGMIALLLLGIVIWQLKGVYKTHQHQQFINSIKDDPAKIHAAMDAGTITHEEAGEMWRDKGEQYMNGQLDKYFAMDAAGRKAWMVEFLTQSEQAEQDRQKWMASHGPSTRPWGNRPNGQANNNNNNEAASRTARAENRNPQRRAQFQQFFADYNAQWKQMGNPGPAPRPGFFGGGHHGH